MIHANHLLHLLTALSTAALRSLVCCKSDCHRVQKLEEEVAVAARVALAVATICNCSCVSNVLEDSNANEEVS